MQYIPDDVLKLIFEAGSEDAIEFSADDVPSFQVVISQVCQRWRDISRGLVTLWTTFRIRNVSADGLRAVATYIALSKQLSVSITLVEFDQCQETWPVIVGLLNSVADRLHMLSLDGCDHYIGYVAAGSRAVCMTHEFHVSPSDCSQEDHMGHGLPLEWTKPELVHLRRFVLNAEVQVEDVPWGWFGALSRLQDLQLTFASYRTNDTPPLSTFLRMLIACPSLISLRVDRLQFSEGGSISLPDGILLDRLRVCAVHCSSNMLEWLGYLIVPAMTRLDLYVSWLLHGEFEYVSLPALVDAFHFTQVLRNVRTLRVVGAHEDDAVRFLRRSPELRDYSMSTLWNRKEVSHTIQALTQSSYNVPALVSHLAGLAVEVSNMKDFQPLLDSLKGLVICRQTCTTPLRRVSIHFRCLRCPDPLDVIDAFQRWALDHELELTISGEWEGQR